MFNKVFGQFLNGKETKRGDEITINCPFIDHNDSTPSFNINIQKEVYNCFGCNRKGSFVGFAMEYYNKTFKEAIQFLELDQQINNNYVKKEYKEIKKEVINYSDYIAKCFDNYLDSKDFYLPKKLHALIGITYTTAIPCLIGYDYNKGWIFPIMEYANEKIYLGFEVRHNDFKIFDNNNKCYKGKGTPSCLSVVYRPLHNSNKKAIICEGFKDSYFMHQYLNEKNKKDVEFTILTPSCGVHTIPELLKKHNLLQEFKEIILVLDNDKAGNDIKNELLINNILDERFKFFDKLGQNQDFENYYKEWSK